MLTTSLMERERNRAVSDAGLPGIKNSTSSARPPLSVRSEPFWQCRKRSRLFADPTFFLKPSGRDARSLAFAPVSPSTPSTPVDPKVEEIFWAAFWPYFALGRLAGYAYLTNGKSVSRPLQLYCSCSTLLVIYCLSRGVGFLLDRSDGPVGFSAVLVFKVLLALYSLHCLVGLSLLLSLQRSNGLSEFVYLWRLCHPDGIIPYGGRVRGWTLFGLVYTISIAVVNGLFTGCGSVGWLVKFPFIRAYMILPEINGVLVFFTSFPFCAAQMAYCSIGAALYYEYKRLNEELLGTPDPTDVQLAHFRRSHCRLTRLTDQADRMLRGFAFAIYSLNIPTLVMVAFMLVREESLNLASRLTFACWTGVLLLQIGVVSVLPSAVHYMAHFPLVYLEELSNACQTELMSTQRYQHLSLFIYQLTSRLIGITGGGFFVITKSLILTVVSMLITYFALLLQFDLSAEPICRCNCNPVVLLSGNLTRGNLTAHF